MTSLPRDQAQDSAARAELPSAAPEAIAQRMEALASLARASAPDVDMILAFDGDGTLWEGDIGVEVFEALLALGPGAIRGAAQGPLRAEADRFNVELSGAALAGDPMALAASIHEAFLKGRYPDREAYAMHAWVFAGWTEAELDAFVDRALGAARIDERRRPSVAPFIERAARIGVPSYIVSASPRAAVRRAAAGLGVPTERILAMTPASIQGQIEPRIEGAVTYGEGKIAALRSARPGATILAAFGDSGWDAAMMRAASVPVAVHPSPSLLAVAASIPGLVVLEG